MKQPAPIKVIVTVALVLLLAGIFWKSNPLLWISTGLIAITLISDFLTEKLAWLWMKIGYLLGYVNSRIILGIVFILILCPIAFFYRIFRKDTLHLKRQKEESNFSVREHTYVPKDLEQMW